MRKPTRGDRDWRHALMADARLALILILLVAASVSWVFLSFSGRDPRQLAFRWQVVNSVQVTRAPDQPHVVVTPLHKTIMDAREAQALYSAAFALPIMPEHMNCPLGPMVVYRLAFSWNGWPALTDTLNLDGCETVNIGGMSTRLCDQQYVALLAQALGMPTDAIEDPPTHQINSHGAFVLPSGAPGGALEVPLVVWRRGPVL